MKQPDLLHASLPGGAAVSCLRLAAVRPSDRLFIYAPGAGSNLNDPFGAFLAEQLAEHDISSVRFQFPYMESGKRTPDRPPVLEATWRAIIAMFRESDTRLIVGGRSMGGRIASQVVATGERVDTLALFAYPLHPPGQPSRRRDEHLPNIKVPTLFCSGTRDAFASPQELQALVDQMPRATLHLLPEADHGFAVPKASAHTSCLVWALALGAFLSFVEAI